jgi:outer membrane beta-barrel protein
VNQSEKLPNIAKTICFLATILLSFNLYAKDVVEFPEEELAQETVLPKFDSSHVVKSRTISQEKRFELSGFYGWNFTEPIFNQSKVGFNASYHWTEFSTVSLNYSKWITGLNRQYTDSLADRYNLDFNRAPAPEYSLFANYEINAYYGKMSFSKESVSHLMIYPIVGLGLNKYQNKSYLGFNGGVGAKFFISKNWAIRSDMKLQYGQYPSPFLSSKMKSTSSTTPSYSEFEDKSTYATIFDLGLTYLF